MAGRATPSSSKSEFRRAGYPRSIGFETERKFLVEDSPGDLLSSPGVPIRQGYLAITEETEVRLRQAGPDLTLTVKNGSGESRLETEVEIERPVLEELWSETEGRRVEKFRRKIDLENGLTAEVDTYEGELLGLEVVEVEFPDESAAASFWPPAWFGRELTGDMAWANQSLAVSGRPKLKDEFRLRPEEEPVSGICRVIVARASQASAAVRSSEVTADQARKVHEARKSLKKVRSALRLLRGVIGDAERDAANQTCREAGRRLSGARDSEVKQLTLHLVTQGEAADDARRMAETWRSQLSGEAAAHGGDLTPEVLGDIAKQIDSVARTFRGLEVSADETQIAANLGRAYRRGRKAMNESRSKRHADSFHAWRKRAKDLRYQLEILEPRLPKKYKKTRKQAEELADLLGDLHDFDVLRADLEGRDLPTEDHDRLIELIGEARERQVESCLDLGRSTYKRKPKKFSGDVIDHR